MICLCLKILFIGIIAFNKAFAFHTEKEMDAWLKDNQRQQEEYFLKNLEAIQNGNLPENKETGIYSNIIYDAIFDIYFDKNIIYDKNNPLDITPKQKKQLDIIKKQYPKTKKTIKQAENQQFLNSKSKYTCVYLDGKINAIAYGDNEFLINKTNVKCITRDLAEWILHKQIDKRVVYFKKSEFYKKWHKKLGDDYLAGIYSKIYQWHPESFIKSNVYKLMLENPFKNAKKIEKEWIKWKQDFAVKRRKDEIAMMYQDKTFKINLTSKQKINNKPKILNDALKEIGLI